MCDTQLLVRSAEAEKDAGDRSYRAGRVAEALQHYTAALRLADSDDTRVDVAAVHANRAQCYLATQQHTSPSATATPPSPSDQSTVRTSLFLLSLLLSLSHCGSATQ